MKTCLWRPCKDIKKRFETSNKVKRPQPINKNIKMTRLIRDELGDRIKNNIVLYRTNTSYRTKMLFCIVTWQMIAMLIRKQ